MDELIDNLIKLFKELDAIAVEVYGEFGYETLHKDEKDEALEILIKRYAEDENNK